MPLPQPQATLENAAESYRQEVKFPAIKPSSFLVISASAILPLASTLPQSTNGGAKFDNGKLPSNQISVHYKFL
nr:hypothetical protein CFP56_17519 [Quercus suber]